MKSEDFIKIINKVNTDENEKYFSGSFVIPKIPPEVGQLNKIKILYLNANGIEEIPSEIGLLLKIEELYLGHNKLKTIPRDIGKLKNLKKLLINHNKIESIPAEIGNLKNLKYLAINSNNLKFLPDEIVNLTNLEYLSLSDNKLIDIPKNIYKLKKLKQIELKGNPLQSPPIEIAHGGISAIMDYFHQLEFEGEDTLYEAKLIIVGEAEAGKTTLAKKIIDSEYKLNPDEYTTEGIDVIHWLFDLRNKKTFRVNIWDFGGQSIYHATHQFFLTQRSLYVLVADSRKEDTDFFYWMNLVELLSNNSPLLVACQSIVYSYHAAIGI